MLFGPSKTRVIALPLAMAAGLLFTQSVTADSPSKTELNPSALTIDRIYKGGEFGSKSSSARWVQSLPATYTTMERSKEYEGFRDIVAHDVGSDEAKTLVRASDLVPPGDSFPIRIQSYQFSEDLNRCLIYTNSKRVWRSNTRGDYWLFDRSSRQLVKLGGDGPESSMMFAKFSPDGKTVAFVRERNLYAEDLFSHEIVPLTESESDDIINGTTDWVYEEEFGLRDAFRWSPDSKSIAYWQVDTSEVQRFPLVNNTDSLYPKVMWFAYPKVGQKNPKVRIGIIELEQKVTKWVTLPNEEEDFYIPRIQWYGETGKLIIHRLNRLQNEVRLYLTDAEFSSVRVIMVEKDDAWVDVNDELMVLDDGEQFTWPSDRDGWRHLYRVNAENQGPSLMTPGEFDVIELLHCDESNKTAYFIASPDKPTERYLWSVGFEDKDVKRVTPTDRVGTHQYSLSPDSKWAIHTFSSANSVPTTALVSLPDHQVKKVLEENESLKKKIQQLSRSDTEFFRVEVEDGVELDGWCIKPPNFDPDKKYPLVCYVYGEPAGSTVVNRWGGQSYLWHLMLAQKGYVVVSIDNRGTKAPRGRSFRKSIYKKIGILPPSDQAAAVRALLKERPYLDASKVAVWGWSGGGSSSLQAIFKYPDLYNTAIAIAPVPNQRYYDTIYQERYMSLPELNVDGFTEGSAINFAKHLEGNLLLVHGTADDNCHYQTTELLIDELIAHDKQFTMFAYPNRTHAVRERKNTTRHLRRMMTSFLLEKMPPNEAP